MFDRIGRSFELAYSSWRVLVTDKQLIVFPLLSGLASLFILATFATPFLVQPHWLESFAEKTPQGVQVHMPLWGYGLLFAFYFCNYFIVVFCNAALITCALMRFNGGTPTIGDGLRAASARLPQIFAWCLVAATVGVIFKAIENATDKAGELVSSLLGAAWGVLTFFVVPVLVVEKVGPFEAVQRSTAMMTRSWGTALVGRFGLGFFLLACFIPVLLLFIVAGVLLAAPGTQVLGFVVLAAAGVGLLLHMAVGSALNGIFLGALYQYATTDRPADGFDAGALRGAFGTR